jgi:transcriptional regulator of arginine metabolism
VSVTARRIALRRLIGERPVGSQAELVDLLAARGHMVTQSTISRDIEAIGARKVVLGNGTARYVVGEPPVVDGPTLSATLGRYTLSARPSGTIVVLRTMPAAGHVVASAIDGAGVHGVIGTIAGDDTVLVVADEGLGAAALARRFDRLSRRA